MTAAINLVSWLVFLTVVFTVILGMLAVLIHVRRDAGPEPLALIRAKWRGWLVGGLVGALLFLAAAVLVEYGSEVAVAGVVFGLFVIVAAGIADVRRRHRLSHTVTPQDPQR